MGMRDETTLAACEVSYRRGNHTVLERVSFQVQSGDIVALLGPNGAGKTTLLRILLGLATPTGGQVLLDGVPIRHLSRRQVARLVAYIPQAHAAAFPYRVRDVVLLGRIPVAGLLHAFTDEDHAKAEAALAAVGLDLLGERPYNQLSGGEHQLVLIARALAQGSRLIVMDEPFASLDYGNRHRLAARLRDLAGLGIGLAMTTHEPEQALGLSTRAVLLAGGKVIADAAPGAALTSESLWAMYRVRAQVVQVNGARTVVAQDDSPCHAFAKAGP